MTANGRGQAKMMTSRKCANASELQTVVRLISSVLAANQPDPYKRFSHDFKLNSIEPSDVLVLTDERENITGTLTIVKRKVKLLGQKVDVAGLAFVCVHPDYQGAGLGRALMDCAVEELKKRKEALSILIARRAVDGFYPKFGYLGTGCFTELIINRDAFADTARLNGVELIAGPVKTEAHRYMRLYNGVYANLPFSFVRGIQWWENAHLWLQYKIMPAQFVNVFYRGDLTGYFIYKDNTVIEAACAMPGMDIFCNALMGFAHAMELPEIIFTMSAKHICSQRLQRLNHTLRQRRAWDGGHMVRIMDRDKFYNLIKDYIERKYSGVFNVGLMRQSIKSIRQTIKGFDADDNDGARELLFEIATGRSNPILQDVGSMFKHSWSEIDCF